MNKTIKKKYPLLTPAFWTFLLASIFGIALTISVFVLVDKQPDKFIGLLSTIIFTLIGTFGIPMSIYLQHKNRKNVFYIDDETQGKTILYTSEDDKMRQRGQIVITAYLNNGILEKTINKINLLELCTKVYTDDVPEICTVKFVPDGTLKRGKTDLHAITDGKHIVVETKQTNKWTANLIIHELVHIVLIANKTNVSHHDVTKGLGV